MSDDDQTHTTTRLADRVSEQLQAQRIVLLDRALDDEIGSRLCSQLVLLATQDPRADITFWINSPGGSVSAMLAIMDTMDLIPNDVSTLAMGMACSAGQFLLTVGTPGKRFALTHSRILMHQGSAGIGGTAVDIELQAQDLRSTRDTVLGIIAQRTGQPLATVAEDSLRDRWYSAAEARDYGFVDGILGSFEGLRPHRRNPVGLSGGTR